MLSERNKAMIKPLLNWPRGCILRKSCFLRDKVKVSTQTGIASSTTLEDMVDFAGTEWSEEEAMLQLDLAVEGTLED